MKMKTLSYERLYAGGFEESEELSSEAFILLFSFACQARDYLEKSQSYLILTPRQQPKHYLKKQLLKYKPITPSLTIDLKMLLTCRLSKEKLQ